METKHKKGYWSGKKRPSPSKETIEKRRLKMIGQKRTPETCKRISDSHLGEKNPVWKGDKVSYSGLHKWVTKELGQPKYCAYCQCIEDKRYEWANISHAYKRDLSDWVRLCCKCHQLFDKGKIKL